MFCVAEFCWDASRGIGREEWRKGKSHLRARISGDIPPGKLLLLDVMLTQCPLQEVILLAEL